MMPRSLPVTIGRPFQAGRIDCSIDVKNASPSTWMIARGYPAIVNACPVETIPLFPNADGHKKHQNKHPNGPAQQGLSGRRFFVFFVANLSCASLCIFVAEIYPYFLTTARTTPPM
jgi:hypothetical protein